MTKWRARFIEAFLASWVVWLLVQGGWAVVIAAVLLGIVTVLEVRWAERWPFSRSSS